MIKTIIFDVYGTLLNTRSCSLVVLQDVIDKCGCDFKAKDVYKKWREKIEEMINSDRLDKIPFSDEDYESQDQTQPKKEDKKGSV